MLLFPFPALADRRQDRKCNTSIGSACPACSRCVARGHQATSCAPIKLGFAEARTDEPSASQQQQPQEGAARQRHADRDCTCERCHGPSPRACCEGKSRWVLTVLAGAQCIGPAGVTALSLFYLLTAACPDLPLDAAPTPESRIMRFVEDMERATPKPAATATAKTVRKAHHPISVLFTAIAKDRDTEHLKSVCTCMLTSATSTSPALARWWLSSSMCRVAYGNEHWS